MRKMAASFNTTVAELEDELMQLILEAQINARIDSHNKVGPPLQSYRQGSSKMSKTAAQKIICGETPFTKLRSVFELKFNFSLKIYIFG